MQEDESTHYDEPQGTHGLFHDYGEDAMDWLKASDHGFMPVLAWAEDPVTGVGTLNVFLCRDANDAGALQDAFGGRVEVLGDRPAVEATQPRGPDAGLLLVFTVDTEATVNRMRHPDPARAVDELIFGDYGAGEALGIGLHMDLLERFGFRGCFFVDVLLEHPYGREQLERVVDAIASRGHEIELHVHAQRLAWGPADLRGLTDALMSGSVDAFRRVMDHAVTLFEQRVGRPPRAYRAGGYRIRNEHFGVLDELGIRIDSSAHAYFNSDISDWMRTRTQPYRVGNVLEVPPSWFLRDDFGETPEPRQFAPNPTAGDPVTQMEAPGPNPMVATYVSHSFQLTANTAIPNDERREEWRAELRRLVGDEDFERMDVRKGGRLFFHEGRPDEPMVGTVTDVLRSVAERPGARCVTFAELHDLASTHWSDTRERPTDPLPVWDANRNHASTSAIRIYTSGLLAQMAADRPDTPPASAPPGFEQHAPAELAGALAAVVEASPAGEPFSLHVRTLGVSGNPPGGVPAAELLFSQPALREYCQLAGREPPAEVTAWDVLTFAAWFEAQGLEVLAAERQVRPAHELDAVRMHPGRLRLLDPAELQTASVEFTLRLRSGARTAMPSAPVVTGGTPDFASVPAERLEQAANSLFDAVRPGDSVVCRLPYEPPGGATQTTIALALLRAGFEHASAEEAPDEIVARLVRPYELAHVKSFA
jgi:hypothetical protein